MTVSQTGVCKACILGNNSPSFLSVDGALKSPDARGCAEVKRVLLKE